MALCDWGIHKYGAWSEPYEVQRTVSLGHLEYTTTTATTVVQERTCKACGKIQTRVVVKGKRR